LITSLYAFQQPTASTPVQEELPQALELEKKEAEALMNEGLWKEATETYEGLQQKCKEDGLEENAMDLYQDLFVVTILREDLEFSEKLGVLKDYKKKEQNSNFNPIYNGAMAHLYTYYGEVDSMQKYYDLASNIYSKDDRPKLEANLNVTIAYEAYFLDKLQLSKTFLEKAEAILDEKLQLKGIDLSGIYNVQTVVYEGLGEYDKALKSNLISIARLEKDTGAYALDLAYEYNNLASIYSSLKDYSNSLAYYLKGLSLIENSADFPKEESASLLYNIGVIYLEQKNYKAAKEYSLKSLSYLSQAAEINKDILADYVNNHQQLAYSYKYLEDLDSALYHIEQAEKINENFPYRIATTYLTFGEIYLAKKDYFKTKEYFNKSLERSIEEYGAQSEFVSSAYLLLSEVASAEKRTLIALGYVQKALKSISIDFSDVEGTTNPKLDNVLYKGELLVVLSHKLKILKKLYHENTSTVKAADVYASAKLATETLEQLNRGMKNKVSKRYWLNTKAIPLFEEAIGLAIDIAEKTKDDSYLNEAFKLSERSKSMLMTDARQEVNASNFGGVPEDLIEQSEGLRETLANAEKARFDARMEGEEEEEKKQDSLIFHCKHDLDVLKHTFEEKYPKYYELKYTTHVATIEQVQEVLDEETTLVEYFEGRSNIYVFTVTKESVRAAIVEKKQDYNQRSFLFQSSLTQMRDVLDNPIDVYNRFTEESYFFYSTMLEGSLVEKPKRLIIIPDGKLGYLPFEVLLTAPQEVIGQGVEEADFGALPYLVKDYIVSYNYSGTLLLAQQAAQKNIINGNILALAPSYADNTTPEWRGERETNLREHLIELPGAEEEVSKLRELFVGKFFIGADANESIFKENAEQHGILHLAMHGLVDKKNPEFSGLAMTEDRGKGEDNFLYAYEIKQLELNAGLVVLSACETGIGKYQRGEGVVSIGRGFIYAGAPALLMTLWSLNDQSGAIIIEKFYKNMSEGQPKDEAIRNAKLYYLDKFPSRYSHPFMWAAFIQVGDYSPIKIATQTSWLLLGSGGVVFLAFLFLGVKVRANRKEV